MRDYLKPSIEEELIEIEDIIAMSPNGEGNANSDGEDDDLGDLW